MPHPHYEPGKYRGVVTGQRFGVTPNDSDYFAIEFEPTAAVGPNQLPATIYKAELTLYFTEKSAPYSIEKLRRIGWDGTRLTQLEPSHPQHTSLIGTELALVCRVNDKGYNDWDLEAPGSSPTAKESDKGVASKLDRLFGKQLMAAVPGGKKAETKPRSAPQQAAVDTEEIPF